MSDRFDASRSFSLGALNERPATSFVYDAGQDLARVVVSASGARASKRSAVARLLIDASGFLVGIDVEPESERRVVVMLGPHEAVADARDGTVDVIEDGGDTREVHVKNAAAACRASAKNPYL